MNIACRIVPIATAFLFCDCAMLAQQAGTGTISVSTQPNSVPGLRTIRQHAPSAHTPVVAGAPYSAEVVTEHIQTLADGTHITNKSQSTKRYRDPQGRMRLESTPGGVQLAEIHDPISGFRYLLDLQNHVAHRYGPSALGENKNGVAYYSQTTRAETPAANSAPVRTVSPQPSAQSAQSSTESLGTQVIEGVYVEGSRLTRTTPTGQTGNDRPIVHTTESWYSPDLKITVLSKNTDPRMGEFTTRLRNIDRTEPDPALFRVPADYQIVDETSEWVEITVQRP